MSIKQIEKNGKKAFIVRVQERSKLYPHIRVQKQITLSGKEATEKKAKLREKDLLYACIEEVKRKEGNDLTFREIIDLWYDYKIKEAYITRETAGDYHRALEKWCYVILNTPCNQITTSEIKSILQRQKDEGISRSFRRKFKSMINNVFKWGIEEGYLFTTTRSPAVGIALEKQEEKKPEILTQSTKAGYYRTVPINPDLRELILELLVSNPDSEFLLPRLPGWSKGYQSKTLRLFLKSIGLPSVKFHTLRACFATLLLQQSKAPAVVMKICGWRDLKTMERYIRLAGVDEKGATDSLKVLPEPSISEDFKLKFV